ncbi:MAG: ABC transporter permease, partial [Promicromonosporaceae bacterium]|nr:ABC transporter permease [Promicromonosporaceae bacterium]
MTTYIAPVVETVEVPDTQAPIEHRVVEKKSFKAPIVMGALTLLMALLWIFAYRTGVVRFRLSSGQDWLSGFPLWEPTARYVGWVCIAAMVIFTVLAWWRSNSYKRQWLWLVGLFAVATLGAFLSWAGAGLAGTISIIDLVGQAILLAIPLVFGALGGVIGERAGVVNIAIEAQLLMSAFTATVVASLTQNAWAGLIAAMVAGLAIGAILGVFAINYAIEQVIIGVVLNVLIAGVTTFLLNGWLRADPMRLNNTLDARFTPIAIPFLSQIPIIGPVFFHQNALVYLMYVTVIGVWFALYHTRWGLRVRAVGEHPKAADTMGIKVKGTRWRALLIAGAIAGIGGASYTANGQFNREMTAGFGFIALAAVIFGNWDPIRASLAGLLFGLAISLQTILGIIGSPVPSQLML